MRVIVIPADLDRSCTIASVSAETWRAEVRQLVNGPFERAVYDRDAALWLHEDGASHLPRNRRATRYVWGHSEAAARNGTNPDAPPYWLFGTVVVTGPDPVDGEPDDAPTRLLAHFDIEAEE